MAAQRLGAGDFSVTVPAEGNDEFAALGTEFNSMARQLEARLEDLQRERARLQEAIRRVGESFAAGLDRVGLLEIVVQTAVDGIGASAGRATMRDPEDRLREVARAGEPEAFQRALHAAEAAVIDAGQIAEIQVGGASALAAPLGATEDGDQVIGMVSVARGDRAFTHGERELFAYLTNQASVSVENVDLHETVQRQAVTDELTGLFNHRRFQEVMTAEVERARRYGHELGLIMLDIDNFKSVNDTYGHLQGDLVLREVARVLRQSSRDVDEPARYGGEEMAVALPLTDLEGAYQFAERVRGRIEALAMPLVEGEGTLKVTASFGVASLATADAASKGALVAAADGALYEAKRSGKNRTVRASTSSPARSAFTASLPGSSLSDLAWDCWTTPSASTWSSSAPAAPTPARSSARSARRSAPRPRPSSRPPASPRSPSRRLPRSRAKRPSSRWTRSSRPKPPRTTSRSTSRRSSRPHRPPRRSPTRGSRRSATRCRPASRSPTRERTPRSPPRTCWRTLRTSSRRPRSTTGCGSSSARRATSTGTSRGPTPVQGPRSGFRTTTWRPIHVARPPRPPNKGSVGEARLVTPDRGAGA